jgi:glycerophosphoryl diester phosphodiesterase
LVIAHRGASADAAENSIEAFLLAASQGADGVELDVRRTADDHLAVLHDAALADGRALVDCRRADVPAAVPSLAEALDACGGLVVNIEIKNSPNDPDFDPDDSVAEAVVALLAERGGRDDVLISSFNPSSVARVRSAAPHLGTAWLVLQATAATVEATVAGGHRAIHPWDHSTTEALVGAARGADLEVNVWTVDDPDRMQALAAMGVTGIVTNVPAIARGALDG